MCVGCASVVRRLCVGCASVVHRLFVCHECGPFVQMPIDIQVGITDEQALAVAKGLEVTGDMGAAAEQIKVLRLAPIPVVLGRSSPNPIPAFLRISSHLISSHIHFTQPNPIPSHLVFTPPHPIPSPFTLSFSSTNRRILLCQALYKLFTERDCTMVEASPNAPPHTHSAAQLSRVWPIPPFSRLLSWRFFARPTCRIREAQGNPGQ